jgi:hypothetical protein
LTKSEFFRFLLVFNLIWHVKKFVFITTEDENCCREI